MTRAVVDASVVLKWLLHDRNDEPDADRALALLAAVRDGAMTLVQPPHWLAEVAAVLVRLSPGTALDDVADLYALDFPVLDTPGMYLTACDLARATGQHVFDTLYHAVAIEVAGTVLITADERYYSKAALRGSILRLRDYVPAEHRR